MRAISDRARRITLAEKEDTPYEDLLLLLLVDEISRRDSNAATRRAEQAGLDPDMVLERWDKSAKVALSAWRGPSGGPVPRPCEGPPAPSAKGPWPSSSPPSDGGLRIPQQWMTFVDEKMTMKKFPSCAGPPVLLKHLMSANAPPVSLPQAVVLQTVNSGAAYGKTITLDFTEVVVISGKWTWVTPVTPPMFETVTGVAVTWSAPPQERAVAPCD